VAQGNGVWTVPCEKAEITIGNAGINAHESYRVKHDVSRTAGRIFWGIRAADLLAKVEALQGDSS
jgi:hypothetical protein